MKRRAKALVNYPKLGPGGVTLSMPSVTQGQIITIYSPKGGTGRTTIATNLAISLFSENTSVILVDGNLQFGDVAVFMNEQGKFSVNDLASRADELDTEVVENVIVKHAQSGIKILPAPFRPENAESVTGDQFGKVLKFLRQMYSYVIVDTSSALTDITLSAIDASDIIILITTQDIPAIKNSRLFLDLADVLGIERRRILFVMNRYDKRIGITAEKVSDNFKHEIVATIPYEERVVVPSVNRGLPFIMSNKTTPVARSILALNEILKQRISELQIQGQLATNSKVVNR
jgi:pilus assembly protein CpaE